MERQGAIHFFPYFWVILVSKRNREKSGSAAGSAPFCSHLNSIKAAFAVRYEKFTAFGPDCSERELISRILTKKIKVL